VTSATLEEIIALIFLCCKRTVWWCLQNCE